jgi:hypothetical protein
MADLRADSVGLTHDLPAMTHCPAGICAQQSPTLIWGLELCIVISQLFRLSSIVTKIVLIRSAMGVLTLGACI